SIATLFFGHEKGGPNAFGYAVIPTRNRNIHDILSGCSHPKTLSMLIGNEITQAKLLESKQIPASNYNQFATHFPKHSKKASSSAHNLT
ncbi:MAG TPA: hypothetical protein PKA76_10590, partial [Pirellulaceae bacterium]|nr:hypothetical protein [Pirellulaceae bacterium]HMP69789.1 hypothetical protein [Pirellulaceae bacterium]